MGAEAWNSYEENTEQIETMDEGPVTSELEISDQDARELEQSLGFSIDEAFDRYISGEESGLVGGNTHAAAGTEDGEVVLEAYRDVPLSSLAHEAVHGIMRQPDGRTELPGDNPSDQTLYEEFVARKAESMFESIETTEVELRALADSRKAYEEACEEYEEFLPDKELDLSREISHIEAIEDQAINEELYGKAEAYRDDRNSVLAAEAARRHEGKKDIEDLVDPDEETYRQTLEYIKNVDDEIFDRYHGS